MEMHARQRLAGGHWLMMMSDEDMESGNSLASLSSPKKRKKISAASSDEEVEEDVEMTEQELELGGDNDVYDEEEEGRQEDGMEEIDEERDVIDDAEDNLDSVRKEQKDVFDDFEFVHHNSDSSASSNVPEVAPADISSWVDGDKLSTVSINKARKFVCIDYPGVVQNKDKALATLGGLDGLAKALSGNFKLELSSRPKDPFCKPALSSLTPAKNFLLRVRRQKASSQAPPNTSTSELLEDQYEYRVEMIGIVDAVYHFDKMCDFQYLPVIKDPDGKYKEILSSIKPTFNDDRNEYFSRQVPIFMPPFSFARREVPASYNFESESVQEGEPHQMLIGLDRKKRNFGAVHISYDCPGVPTSPDPEALANISKLPQEHQDSSISTVKKLFEHRPVWSRSGLLAHLESSQHKYLKVVLPLCAYYMLNGPWRGMWCKFGYDPRKEPKAKQYQTVDYRIRSVLNRQKVESKRGLEICRFSQINNQKILSTATLIPTADSGNSSQAELNTYDLEYKFLPNHIPPYRQMHYQVCDVQHEEVQRLLHKNDGQETTCTERDGWCVPDFTCMCRDILSAAVEKLFAK